MRVNTRAVWLAVAAFAVLIGTCLVGAAHPNSRLVWVSAGFVAYVAFGSRAMALWRVDEKIFDHPPKFDPPADPD